MSKVKIIEVPSEIGAGTRGSSTGIQAIKAAAFNKNSSIFLDTENIAVNTDNDTLFEESEAEHAIRIKAYHRQFERTFKTVFEQSTNADKLVFLTGDHSNAAAILKAIRQARPQEKLGVLWIDAHADLHSPYTSPSGNIHGMPLAITLQEDNLEMKKNEPTEDTVRIWNEMKSLTMDVPPIELFFIGLRDLEKEEIHLIEKYNIPNKSVEDVTKEKLPEMLKYMEAHFNDCDSIYISFDVDSMDPSKVSDGTGTPVPGGLDMDQALLLIDEIMRHLPKVKYFEITEVNPILDSDGNRMGEAALKILEHAIIEFSKEKTEQHES